MWDDLSSEVAELFTQHDEELDLQLERHLWRLREAHREVQAKSAASQAKTSWQAHCARTTPEERRARTSARHQAATDAQRAARRERTRLWMQQVRAARSCCTVSRFWHPKTFWWRGVERGWHEQRADDASGVYDKLPVESGVP